MLRFNKAEANHELSQVLRGEIADQEASKQFKEMMGRTVEMGGFSLDFL